MGNTIPPPRGQKPPYVSQASGAPPKISGIPASDEQGKGMTATTERRMRQVLNLTEQAGFTVNDEGSNEAKYHIWVSSRKTENGDIMLYAEIKDNQGKTIKIGNENFISVNFKEFILKPNDFFFKVVEVFIDSTSGEANIETGAIAVHPK